jgi:folate-dependent phosphoribosylglycinamide formyltransferase PurN
MRVAIVTGRAPHHKHLCAKLSGICNVVAILHPSEHGNPRKTPLGRLMRQVKSRGLFTVVMYVLGKVFARAPKSRAGARDGFHKSADFSESVAAYDQISRSLVHSDCNVRDPATIDLLRSVRPDVTVCLGGPVYPRAFIEASPLTLNFHSGIAPIYNGAASIHFAFANAHPHLCGGTLMVMGVEVDGGRILGHYLPEVESGDTPDSLFAKTVRGAALMYARLLEQMQIEGTHLQQVPQPPPLFYTRAIELGLYQKAMIVRYAQLDFPARHKRPEALIEYWREPTGEAALSLYRTTLDRLLWSGAEPTAK